ncbi:GNAT family N-acetyltransferase [Neolewinella lacunae]|nr:GNAT family N-acetyltransferase [Neolewinella lacunae]MDN3633429.1 GNAT family N-acetyltransferase [Neolewinella lacunae]
MRIRPITSADNRAVAQVIRTVMPEFNCVGEGFSINDPEVDDMAAHYNSPGATFFVLETGAAAGAPPRPPEWGELGRGAEIVGCAGFAPLTGSDGKTCELRKMYLLPSARGQGGGKMLMTACLEGARQAGYTQIYLETVTAMETAQQVYLRSGFRYIEGPLGATGHSGCDRFMIRDL